MAAKEI